MEWILVIVAVAALACPIAMLGPALLARLGIRRGASGMSCMDMSGGSSTAHSIEQLNARRAEVERELAKLEAASTPEPASSGGVPRRIEEPR